MRTDCKAKSGFSNSAPSDEKPPSPNVEPRPTPSIADVQRNGPPWFQRGPQLKETKLGSELLVTALSTSTVTLALSEPETILFK